MANSGLHIYLYLPPIFIAVGLGVEALFGKVHSWASKLRKAIAVSSACGVLLMSFLVSHYLLVDHDPEFPWNDKRMFWTTKEGLRPGFPLMGFPYRRDWPLIAATLENLPSRETSRFATNEKRDIVDFYLGGVMEPLSRNDSGPPTALYIVSIKGPQSWSKSILGRSLEDWDQRQELTRVSINEFVDITLVDVMNDVFLEGLFTR